MKSPLVTLPLLVSFPTFPPTISLFGNGLASTSANTIACCSRSLSANWLPPLLPPTSAFGEKLMEPRRTTTLLRAPLSLLPILRLRCLLIRRLAVLPVLISLATGFVTAPVKTSGLHCPTYARLTSVPLVLLKFCLPVILIAKLSLTPTS
jgi:hypothetical protein